MRPDPGFAGSGRDPPDMPQVRSGGRLDRERGSRCVGKEIVPAPVQRHTRKERVNSAKAKQPQHGGPDAVWTAAKAEQPCGSVELLSCPVLSEEPAFYYARLRQESGREGLLRPYAATQASGILVGSASAQVGIAQYPAGSLASADDLL